MDAPTAAASASSRAAPTRQGWRDSGSTNESRSSGSIPTPIPRARVGKDAIGAEAPGRLRDQSPRLRTPGAARPNGALRI